MRQKSFAIIDQIDSGGMCDIFLGIYSPTLKRPCVVKTIKREYLNDDFHLQSFRSEAIVGQRLNHSNIVQVFDYDQDENAPALVMEYIDGGNLAEILSRCGKMGIKLSVPMAVMIANEVARALDYAHNTTSPITGEAGGVIHRDISLANIMITNHGEVKITDFGVASLKDQSEEGRGSVLRGKIGYFAPEQLRGKGESPQTDIFSLGVCLWEMLAMRRMYPGDDLTKISQLVKSGERPEITRYNPKLDAPLLEIVEKCLAVDPVDRYQSAAHLEKELTSYLNNNYARYRPSKLGTFIRNTLSKRIKKRSQLIETALNNPDLFPKEEVAKPAFNQNSEDATEVLDPSLVPTENAKPLFVPSAPITEQPPNEDDGLDFSDVPTHDQNLAASDELDYSRPDAPATGQPSTGGQGGDPHYEIDHQVNRFPVQNVTGTGLPNPAVPGIRGSRTPASMHPSRRSQLRSKANRPGGFGKLAKFFFAAAFTGALVYVALTLLTKTKPMASKLPQETFDVICENDDGGGMICKEKSLD